LERIKRDEFLVFKVSDLVAIFTSIRFYTELECTIHNSVLVLWFDGYDTRLLDVIDDMIFPDRSDLVVTCVAKGTVRFLWKEYVPVYYREGEIVESPRDGDSWIITESIAATESEMDRINYNEIKENYKRKNLDAS